MDWGFTKFFKVKKLYVPREGQSSPLVENDELELMAFVRVLSDPTGMLWQEWQR